MIKLISKYQYGSTISNDYKNILDYIYQNNYKNTSSDYQEGKFLGSRWNTRYDGKVEWNGNLYPSWIFVEPEWYKQMTEPSSLNLPEIKNSYKILSQWFSSLFNQNQQPKQNSTAKEPKERPGIGRRGDR